MIFIEQVHFRVVLVKKIKLERLRQCTVTLPRYDYAYHRVCPMEDFQCFLHNIGITAILVINQCLHVGYNYEIEIVNV